MTGSDLTVEILRDIRDSVRALDKNLSSRIDQTNARLDQANARLDTANERLGLVEQRLGVVEHVVRDAADQIAILARHVKRKTDADLADLRERVTKLEVKVG